MRLSVAIRAVLVPIVALAAIIIFIRPNTLPFPKIAVFLLGFALFVDLATVFKGHIRNACVVFATLALGMAGVEAFGEARAPKVVENHMNLWAQDTVLGYHAEKPGVVTAEKTVDGHPSYRVSYSIDDKLRRRTRSSPDGPKVRVFGDSYAFGEGLNDDDAWPQIFADSTGANVENYGYPGYSPAQALRALQLGMFDTDITGARLFILQTAPFHIERVACKPDWTLRFPRYVTVDGTLELQGRCKPLPWQDSGIYRMLLQTLDQKVRRADVENYINVVDAFTKLATTKYHAAVLILDMVTNAKELKSTGLTSKDVEARFRQAGAMVLDDTVPAKPGDVLEIPYDGHPTATANHLLVRKVIDYIENARPDLLMPSSHGPGPTPADQAEK